MLCINVIIMLDINNDVSLVQSIDFPRLLAKNKADVNALCT